MLLAAAAPAYLVTYSAPVVLPSAIYVGRANSYPAQSSYSAAEMRLVSNEPDHNFVGCCRRYSPFSGASAPLPHVPDGHVPSLTTRVVGRERLRKTTAACWLRRPLRAVVVVVVVVVVV